jgi:TonB-linked SusC/RagA family outer membrane protein
MLACQPLCHAQTIAMGTQNQNDPVNASEGATHSKVKDILNDLRKHYKADILFSEQVVAGYLVPSNAVNLNNSLEANLKSVLNPIGLHLKKSDDGSYFISRNLPTDKGFHKPGEGLANPSTGGKAAQGLVAKTITGKVISETGEPLIGVTVVLKGTNTGTSTDAAGNYSIEVPDTGGALIFSYIGFLAREVVIGNAATVHVTMAADAKSLEEVVVVGYGTMRRSDITGAVSSVKFNEKEAAQITSVDKLLQGRSPGVYVNSGSAAPGGAVNVRIRGASSFSGGNEPLYVVDGIIINTASQDVDNSLQAGTNPGNSSQEAQNGLTAINPQDIQSIEILKDASATAIYGSRGANGVVLITTKQGRSGKAQVQFSSSTEVARVSKMMPMLNGHEFAAFRNQTEALLGRPPVYNLSKIEPVDWQKDIFDYGVTTNNRLSISGSNEKSNYYLAAGILNNEGVIPTTGLSQGDVRVNLTHHVSKRFKVSSRTGLIYRRNSMTQSTEQMGSASNSIVRQMLSKAPIYDTLAVNELELDQDIEGPRAWLKDYDDISKEFRVTESITMDYKLSEAFTVSVLGGLDLRFKDRHRWFGKTLGQGRNTNGQLGYSSLKNYTYNTQALLYYNKTYGKHRLNGTIGATFDKNNLENTWTVNENFWTEDLRIYGLGVGARVYPFTEQFTGSSILSGLARMVYSYNDKYVLTATGRADGTSRFAPGSKWGYFPSMAFAWHAADEAFIKALNLFSTLKPRIGFGMTGNQAVSPYSTLTRYSAAYYAAANETVVVGAAPSLIANKDLKWESSSQVNFGFDMGFWKDRITFTADLYHKKTKDLLQELDIPTSTGFSSIWVNRGSIENRGLELALDGIIADGALQWTTGANIAFNRNKIADIGLPEGQFGNMRLKAFLGKDVAGGSEFHMPANIFAQGYPMAMFFGYQTKGIYQETDAAGDPLKLSGVPLKPGDVYFVDQNGDGNINDADKVVIGNPNPKFTYGFTSALSYKRFSLNVFVNGVYGNQIANGNILKIEDTSVGLNITKDAYHQAWTPQQASNPKPRLLYKNGDFTDRILEDGSYLRLGMVTLGYKPNLGDWKWFNGLDLYVTGRNLLTFTHYSGYDPEVNSFTNDPLRTGVDWSSYPNVRSLVFGVNVTF